MTLGASAQKGSFYLHLSQSGTITSYNLADISKVHFGGNTMDIVTAGGTDSYAYSPLNTATVSTDPDPQLDYTNGFGTDGSYEAPSQDDSGYYLIDNGGKLFWLAQQVNNGVGTAYNAKLTADIDLENRLWTPMGDATHAHTGVFDGQGHSITGLNIVAEKSTTYAAFIGNHTGTNNITDFHISGTVTAKGTGSGNYAAGVVANANGSHKIQDVWCSVNIVNANTTAVSCRLAGIVTHALSCTVNRCVYDGTIDGKATSLANLGAELDIGTTTCHVGCNGDHTLAINLLASLRNNVSLLLVEFGVQHLMRNVTHAEHAAEHLADVDRCCTHQHGSSRVAHEFNFLDNSKELLLGCLIDAVGHIIADDRLVGGDGHDIQFVDVHELTSLGLGSTGHTRQLVIHAEVVLQCNRGKCLRGSLNVHALLGLNSLV